MKILVVDDHVIFREELVGLLQAQPDIDVVGEAGTVRQAISLAKELDVDVILLDFSLPDGTGLDVERAVLAEKPGTRIIFLTVHDDHNRLFAALRSGASGYLLKNLPAGKLIASLRGMEKGEAPISRKMTNLLVQEFSRLEPPKDPDHSIISRLTLREIEILQEVAAGSINKEIADRLSLSETTVKNHMHRIFDKLGLQNRREAAIFARNHGLNGFH